MTKDWGRTAEERIKRFPYGNVGKMGRSSRRTVRALTPKVLILELSEIAEGVVGVV